MGKRMYLSRSGRRLELVRQIQFVPPPLAAQFWRLLTRPGRGVWLVVRAKPSLLLLAGAVTLAGLLRGFVDAVDYYQRTGQLWVLAGLVKHHQVLAPYAGRILLLQVAHTLFLWAAIAAICWASGQVLGGRGRLRPILQVTGVALLAAPAAGLINLLPIGWPWPLAAIQPPLGVGQIAIGIWMMEVCHQVHRRIHKLDPLAASLAAPLPVVASLVISLAAAGLVYGLVPTLPYGDLPAVWMALR